MLNKHRCLSPLRYFIHVIIWQITNSVPSQSKSAPSPMSTHPKFSSSASGKEKLIIAMSQVRLK